MEHNLNKNKTNTNKNTEDEVASAVQEMEALGIQPQNKQVKLGGAARKRFKWLRKQGHDPKEAQQLALKPMDKNPKKDGGAKRGRSDDSTPMSTVGKKHKSSHSAEQNFRTSGVSYNMVAGSVKLAIMSEEHPKSLISEVQLRTLEEAILDRVIELKGGVVKPQFLSSKFKTGWMILVCANNETAVWLKENFKEVKLWEGAKVKLVEENDFPQIHTITGRFPNSAESSSERILGLIEGQNSGLNVSSWKVLRRDIDGQVVFLTLSVDEESYEALNKMNLSIMYRYGPIKLRTRSTKTGHAEEQKEGENLLSKETASGSEQMDCLPEVFEEGNAKIQIPIDSKVDELCDSDPPKTPTTQRSINQIFKRKSRTTSTVVSRNESPIITRSGSTSGEGGSKRVPGAEGAPRKE